MDPNVDYRLLERLTAARRQNAAGRAVDEGELDRRRAMRRALVERRADESWRHVRALELRD